MYKQKLTLLLSTLFVIAVACKNKQEETNRLKEEFNFEIIYDYQHLTEREDKYRYKASPDKLYLFIESQFENDTIKIFVDNRTKIEEVVTTELSTGLATVIEIERIDDIKKIVFSINNSPEISFDIFNKKMNLIGVDKENNNIKILFYKRVPIYD